jgi:TonB family protein
MKRAVIIILGFLLFSCESNDVEVIPDYTLKYSLIEKEKYDEAKRIFEKIDFAELLNYKNVPENKQVTIYLTHFALFVNEDGELEKVQIRTPIPRNNFAKYEEKIDEDISPSVYQPVIEKLSESKFPVNVVNGKKVKTRISLGLNLYLPKTKVISEIKKEQSKTYFVAAEEMPSPIGGLKAIQEKIVYPEKAKQNGIEGRVYVKAYINKEGIVEKVDVIKGIGYGCDSVAVAAVKQTKFKPGSQRGKKIPMQVSIPVNFQLN